MHFFLLIFCLAKDRRLSASLSGSRVNYTTGITNLANKFVKFLDIPTPHRIWRKLLPPLLEFPVIENPRQLRIQDIHGFRPQFVPKLTRFTGSLV